MKKNFAILSLLLAIASMVSAQKLLQAVEAKDYKSTEQAIKAGEDVNAPNQEGQFPLWNATWHGDAKMVELLLKNGANAKQKFRGEQEIGLLEVSSQEGHLEITDLLAKAGADVNERSFRGQTPLRIAARNGHVELVKYFLSKGCDVNTKGEDGATPLEHAAGKGHLEIVKLLVQKGGDMNMQDKEGDFALGEAARGGFLDVVNYLLAKGADVSLKNAEGSTAEEIARLAGQPKIQALLKEK